MTQTIDPSSPRTPVAPYSTVGGDVGESSACPKCGQRDADQLLIDENDLDKVTCMTCQHVYQLPDPARFGTVTYKGTTLRLTQAFVAGTASRPHYEAVAADDSGNTYRVRWALKSAYVGADGDAVSMDKWPEDESEMCDWDNPESVQLIEKAAR